MGTFWLQRLEAQQCMLTLNAITVAESLVGENTNETRVYTLCPNTIYNVGFLNFDREFFRGQSPLPLRPNMLIRCGENGSRENGCIINGGDLQVDGTSKFGVSDESIQNVIIRGLTFRNASMHNAWLQKPGDVQFQDCLFTVRCLHSVIF